MKLTIPFGDGAKWTVDAEIVGDLAIHEQRYDEGAYTVTYVPTLMTLQSVIPKGLEKKKAKLLKWAALVQEGVPKDWLALRKYTRRYIMEHPDETRKLRERIRNRCLGVKT